MIGKVALDVGQHTPAALRREVNLDAVLGAQHQFAGILRQVGPAVQKAARTMIGQRQMQPQPVMAARQRPRQRLVLDAGGLSAAE